MHRRDREKDQALLNEFNNNVTRFFTYTNWQRAEVYRSYEYRDCNQWTAEDWNDRKRLNKQITVINLAAPIVRAVSGTECMKDKKLDFVPVDEQFDEESDIMGDAVEYCQYASGYDAEQSMAREDAATCGLGATVTYLDMTQKNAIAGVPIVERVFPGFLFYDNSGRGSNLNSKARWMGYADPVSNDNLSEYIADKMGEIDAEDYAGGDSDFKAFLMSFSRQENQAEVDFIYHYFWWEYDDIYDVANPFLDPQHQVGAMIMQDEDVANMIGDMAKELQIDWQAGYWSLDKESFNTFKNALETVGLLMDTELPKLDYSKRKGKCYYRAEIARGLLLSRSRSYTQDGHPLNFITGYYDESQGIYYGMMRPLSFVQDALNMSVSEFLGYAKTATSGGGAYVKGGSDSLLRLKKEKAQEDALTPLPANAEVIPKAMPTAPQVLTDFIRLMMEVMPRTLGLGQEFLGVISSGDMTDSLYGKVMKQSYAVLANFENNSAAYSRRQGKIFMDIVRLMADANDGMVLPILSPNHDEKAYIRLRQQNLAAEYAIRIVERPMTLDERQESFNMLSQLAPQFMQAGVNIMPTLAKLSNLDSDIKKELVELATPKPPQPDPLNQAMLDSQTKLQYAQAAKLQAEAEEHAATAPTTAEKQRAEIDKTRAETDKIRKEAAENPERKHQLAVREQDMKHSLELRKIDSNERIKHKQAELSSKPTATVQIGAADALDGVVGRLHSTADNLDKLAQSASHAHTTSADALHKAAGALAAVAGHHAKPKRKAVKGIKRGKDGRLDLSGLEIHEQ